MAVAVITHTFKEEAWCVIDLLRQAMALAQAGSRLRLSALAGTD